jgi:lipopolysaccharide biosynthesis protein
LCKKIQLPDTLYPKIHFIAGTMFYARISALEPIMDLHLTQDDFENEEGQNDGTMAHAIERAIGASCLKMGLTIVDTTSEMNSIKCTSTLNYRFSP